jgi:hypothetical protein
MEDWVTKCVAAVNSLITYVLTYFFESTNGGHYQMPIKLTWILTELWPLILNLKKST